MTTLTAERQMQPRVFYDINEVEFELETAFFPPSFGKRAEERDPDDLRQLSGELLDSRGQERFPTRNEGDDGLAVTVEKGDGGMPQYIVHFDKRGRVIAEELIYHDYPKAQIRPDGTRGQIDHAVKHYTLSDDGDLLHYDESAHFLGDTHSERLVNISREKWESLPLQGRFYTRPEVEYQATWVGSQQVR